MSDPDPVSLEFYKDEEGFLSLRTSDTKRPLAGVQKIEVEGKDWAFGEDPEDLEVATVRCLIANDFYDPAKR